jgi:hypothetical protein
MARKKILALLFIAVLLWPLASRAATVKSTYPRLANYFLQWSITDAEVPQLAKWDLLIVDMEAQENSRAQLLKIRALNPHIIILAYLTSEEILDNINDYNNAYLRQRLAQGLSDGWWLRDTQGQKISNWPYTSMLNLSDGARPNAAGQRFNDYLPEFVVTQLKSSGLWDGVFYDNTWGTISWLSNKNLDLNNDGVADTPSQADSLWSAGFKKMLATTRSLAGPDFIIVGNGQVYNGYQSLLNGMMLEDFPSPWENGGTWAGSMQTYLNLPTLEASPQTSIINVYDKNQANYQLMRFGLTSTLLGDGLYSYDYDVTNHGQTWWYDEYDVNLGPAQSGAYNLINPQAATTWQPGLWRRDFTRGIALVNSTAQKQTYIFAKEEFDKITGTQDPSINSGQKVNYIQLAPQDGVILLKRSSAITNSAFTNGYFYRIFNATGSQTRPGMFSYVSAYPGQAQVIMASGSNDSSQTISLSAASGLVSLFKNGKTIAAFTPYGRSYKNSLSLGAQVVDGYFKTIVLGTGLGGGPQVQIFSPAGRALGSFFAYDKTGRGGVNVALADIDGDGQPEIITGPGPGTAPVVKVFSLAGQLKSSFLAYDSKFRGGVNVAVGDLYGDGQQEIVTSPESAGGPQIRIFNSQGQTLRSFFAYDQNFHGGVTVTVSDLNADNQADILVGLKNFY